MHATPLPVQPFWRFATTAKGLGGKGESADRAEGLPRSKIVRVKFPGHIEPGDVQNTITPMFGRNMYENLRSDSTALWSPDLKSLQLKNFGSVE